jgi:NADP-dependent 3-hydroxy acid dehydrogenase YdfG
MVFLQDQVAVVTGASSGIGRAISLDLARNGAEVCLVARRRQALESVAQVIVESGGRGHVHCTDLTKDEDLDTLVETIRVSFNRVDVLVLCGGVIARGTIEDTSVSDLDLQYRTNVRGQYSLIWKLLPQMTRQLGQIVFINSSVATRPAVGGLGQFTATQYAMHAIADSLREEVNGLGIRVLSVFPSRTATPRTAEFFEKAGRPYDPKFLMQPEDVASMVIAALSLPRTAEVTDMVIRAMKKTY